MKKWVLFMVSVCCILSLAGCAEKPPKPSDDTSHPLTSGTQTENTGTGTREGGIVGEGDMLGIGFFGYIDSESDEKAVRGYVTDSALANAYPFLKDCDPVLLEGAELYALVPANKDTAVTVYRAEPSEDGSYIDHRDTPLYAGKAGETVVLRCNLSEIHANVLLSVSDGKNTLEFHPMISLENGRVIPEPGCYDFSVYEEKESDAAETARELLLATDEVQTALERGMKLLDTGDTQTIEGRPCLLFALGTDRENQFVRERYYAVSEERIYVYSPESDSWGRLGDG